jgi:hypothetical protein
LRNLITKNPPTVADAANTLMSVKKMRCRIIPAFGALGSRGVFCLALPPFEASGGDVLSNPLNGMIDTVILS